MAKTERNGQRKTRDRFPRKAPDLGYYFVVTDTNETEQNYIYGLRDSLPKELQGRIVIKVQKTKTNKLVDVCKEQAALHPQYGEPWIVFDRDKVVCFDEIIREAQYAGVNVGWSNPCIEIWFAAYFGAMPGQYDSVTCCHKFADIFQKNTGQEYRKSSNQIYTMLTRYGDEKQAIEIAETRLQGHINNSECLPSQMCPCTTIHKFVDEIKRKVENR